MKCICFVLKEIGRWYPFKLAYMSLACFPTLVSHTMNLVLASLEDVCINMCAILHLRMVLKQTLFKFVAFDELSAPHAYEHACCLGVWEVLDVRLDCWWCIHLFYVILCYEELPHEAVSQHISKRFVYTCYARQLLKNPETAKLRSCNYAGAITHIF